MGNNLLSFVVNSYWVLCAVAVGIAVWFPRTPMVKIAAGVGTALVVSIPLLLALKHRAVMKPVVAKQQAQASRAAQRFAELCKGAGIKINRTVDDVEAVMLLKVRPRLEWKDYNDPMLPGAAMASEWFDDSYIESFLGGEMPIAPSVFERNMPPSVIEERKSYRGGINTLADASLPRYRFVDAIEPRDGVRYRYTIQHNITEATSANGTIFKIDRPSLKREPATDPAPRYAVDYEDIVDPDDRNLWIAGSIVRVIDQQTQEVLAEYTTYASGGGPAGPGGTTAPWQYAASHRNTTCPRVKGSIDTHTRYFVDRVLKLKQGS